MNKLALVLGTLVVSTVLGAMPACYGDATGAHEGDVAEEATRGGDAAIVGKWQFVYDQTARTRVETQLAAEAADPTALRNAKAAAEKEAAQSQIEFTEDGDFFSWVEGQLILQAPYAVQGASKSSLRLAMKVEGQDKTTTVTLHGDDEIVIDDPRKGPLTFRRIK